MFFDNRFLKVMMWFLALLMPAYLLLAAAFFRAGDYVGGILCLAWMGLLVLAWRLTRAVLDEGDE